MSDRVWAAFGVLIMTIMVLGLIPLHQEGHTLVKTYKHDCTLPQNVGKGLCK